MIIHLHLTIQEYNYLLFFISSIHYDHAFSVIKDKLVPSDFVTIAIEEDVAIEIMEKLETELPLHFDENQDNPTSEGFIIEALMDKIYDETS